MQTSEVIKYPKVIPRVGEVKKQNLWQWSSLSGGGGVLKPAAPSLLGNMLKVQILGFPFQTLNPNPWTLIPTICAPNVTQLIQCGFGTEPHPWCLGR